MRVRSSRLITGLRKATTWGLILGFMQSTISLEPARAAGQERGSTQAETAGRRISFTWRYTQHGWLVITCSGSAEDRRLIERVYYTRHHHPSKSSATTIVRDDRTDPVFTNATAALVRQEYALEIGVLFRDHSWVERRFDVDLR